MRSCTDVVVFFVLYNDTGAKCIVNGAVKSVNSSPCICRGSLLSIASCI